MGNDTSSQEKKGVTSRPRLFAGVVVSDKMKDTVVVAVTRFVKHSRYGKYSKRVKRYQVHDPGNTKKEGDKISIVETKPISRHKHFRIVTSE